MQSNQHRFSLLWAKKDRGGGLAWLPLFIHLHDSARVGRFLWRDWVPSGVRSTIAGDVFPGAPMHQEEQEALAGDLLVFLCAAHDLGKATPVFQVKTTAYNPSQLDSELLQQQRLAGIPMPTEQEKDAFLNARATPHGLAGQQILLAAGCERSVAAVLGAHHGKPVTSKELRDTSLELYPNNYHLKTEGRAAWSELQQEAIRLALSASGFQALSGLPRIGMAAQVLFSGLVIMADWIASNDRYFPYIPWQRTGADMNLEDRAASAMRALRLPPYWEASFFGDAKDLYSQRFDGAKGELFTPYPMQRFVADIAQNIVQPGILIIEAAMGQGKTEAALVAAEVLAHKTGRSGVFFALPTQATSDGIFPRMQRWASKLTQGETHSIRLAHGKAQFNKHYQDLFEGAKNIAQDDVEEGLMVHPWFEGRKKALLADFVVGTVDQALLMSLKQKHVMLRHLGLAGKVVIIDECHAYDAYMSQYLERTLNWLAAYGVPAIVLSATLPGEKRLSLVRAYLSGLRPLRPGEAIPLWASSTAYPLVTWTDGDQSFSQSLEIAEPEKKVTLEDVAWDDVAPLLESALKDGGCAGVILNTVDRAQQMARMLQAVFPGEVSLLHSRFLAPHRAMKEDALQNALGKPGPQTQRPARRIVVGTQVLEQSLDIDFDLLVTDLCPMDLLLQRMGRMHRHNRRRPLLLCSPRCYILGCREHAFEPGGQAIYGEYYLLRTQALLKDSITLPTDIPHLVQAAYDDSVLPEENHDRVLAAKQAHDERVHRQRRRADAWRLVAFQPGAQRQRIDNLLEVLNRADEEAAVRDIDDSIEVLAVRRQADGMMTLVSGGQQAFCFSPLEVPDARAARLLARQSLRLAGPLVWRGRLNTTIQQLEEESHQSVSAWQQSPWLKGSLFLILNEKGETVLNGIRLRYDEFYGLIYQKEDETLEQG